MFLLNEGHYVFTSLAFMGQCVNICPNGQSTGSTKRTSCLSVLVIILACMLNCGWGQCVPICGIWEEV